MYHAIVRRRIQNLFAAINRGDADPVLNGFSSRFEHIFIGQHALSGRRDTLEATRDWYRRLFRLMPDLRFTLHRIDVAGPPWATLATIEWEEQNSGTDGVPTRTGGVHVVNLRWGKMTRLIILTDTQALCATLTRTIESSHRESQAVPIETRPGWPGIA